MAERYSVERSGEVVVLRDAVRKGEARVEAARGNNVTVFRVAPPAGGEAMDVLLSGDLGASGYSAGNPILFPFPNRVKGGAYTFEGKSYQLDINETARGNHIHGLVSGKAWTLEDAGASEREGAWQRASCRLDSDQQIARQYPFQCTITVT